MPRITAIHRFRPRQDDQSHVILVDEDGDLKLLIGAGTEQREFHVCSKTLARASQVFRGIVSAKPVALQANLEWVVELPEDDPEAAADPLYITHGMKAFVGGETDPTPEGLLAILTFADRYALKSWLRPSAPSWIPRGPVNSQTCESEEDFASVVALAWGFGLRADFLLVTRRLATEFGADECGRLVGANQQAIAAVAERAGLLSLIPHGYFGKSAAHKFPRQWRYFVTDVFDSLSARVRTKTPPGLARRHVRATRNYHRAPPLCSVKTHCPCLHIT